MIIINIVLATLAASMAYLAYRERQRTLATKVSVEVSRLILRDCNTIMDDGKSSMNLKVFVSHVATMAISNEFLYQLGTNPEVFKAVGEHAKAHKREGNKGSFDMLTDTERDRLKPTMAKLSLASLAFNPEHGKAVRYMVEADMIDDVVALMMNPNAAAKEPTKPRAQEMRKVSMYVPKIEKIMAAELCAAF